MKKTRRSYNSTLKPSKGPTRKTRLRAKGGHRFPKNVNEAFREWIRNLPCVCDRWRNWPRWWVDNPDETWNPCGGPVCCCHLKTRGSGGVDVGNAFPACEAHHTEQEGKTREFQERYGLDLKFVCAGLASRWREQQGETTA